MTINEMLLEIYSKFGRRVTISFDFRIYDDASKEVEITLYYKRPFESESKCLSFDSIAQLEKFVEYLLVKPDVSKEEFDRAASIVDSDVRYAESLKEKNND